MGLFVPNAAQEAPLQISSCSWCSCLCSCNEPWVQESQSCLRRSASSDMAQVLQSDRFSKLGQIFQGLYFLSNCIIPQTAEGTVTEVLGLTLLICSSFVDL